MNLKDFADKVEQLLREEAKNQLVESKVTYVEIDRNDVFDISAKLICKRSVTLLEFDIGKMPIGMPLWNEKWQKQRIREEWAIVTHSFNKGNIKDLTGAFSFVCCYPLDWSDTQ